MAILKTMMASMLALAGYQYVGQKVDEATYPPIGRKIDVGGYKLHAIEVGQNNDGPTVVIDPGMGCNSLSWGLVYPEIAKFARVVVVDRAGYAWSDASPLPRTSENIVQELHTLLENGKIQKPYILVGHSFGGINARLFASKYSKDVSGIVLVDSSHEDQGEKLSFLPQPALPTMISKWKLYIMEFLGLHEYDQKVEKQIAEDIKNFPQDVQKSFMPCLLSVPSSQARQAEKLNFELSRQQLKQAEENLGDMPLTVITRGKKSTVQDYKGQWTQEQLDQYQNQIWPELQADLVTKSSQGKQIIAERSGHMVNRDQPEIIVSAVRQMYEELKK